MKTRRLNRKLILSALLAVLVLMIIVMGISLMIRSCSAPSKSSPASGIEPAAMARLDSIMTGKSANTVYGIDAGDYDLEQGEIRAGETFSKLLNGRFGLNIAVVNKLVDKAKGVIDLREMRAGNSFTAFVTHDSVQTLKYLAYDKSNTEYVLIDCSTDNPKIAVIKREITVTECYAEGVIQSSLSATIAQSSFPNQLSNRLDDIFKWTIDFSALQKGDSFRVLYEEVMIDTVRVGIKRIYGAEFIHNNKSYLAVGFEQGGEKGYWDQDGVNLRKAFLRAPLSFQARVSSKFGVRVHPITRRRGQHNGVDYACATGTPILAVANGTIVKHGWDPSGGGNMIRIRHEQGLQSTYMHLSRFNAGVANGSRVTQGQVIGYVGSTGMSTGPHLDFRIQKNNVYVDPTKMQSLPSKPISAGNRGAFDIMKRDVLKVMAEYKLLTTVAE